MVMVMDAKSTEERLERLEKVLGIVYRKEGNVASVSSRFGEMTKVEVV